MHNINTRAIVNKNISLPFGMGAMPLSIVGRPNEHDAIDIILHFLAEGGNFIDTADVYGINNNDLGHNERLIAKAIKKYGYSEDLIIATKGGASRPQDGWGLGNGHPEYLRKACENSLQNLKIESHFLYYLHGPDSKVPLSDSLVELVRLKEEGKIQNIGISNVDLDQLNTALKLTPIAAVQNRCNLFCKEDITNGLIDFCSAQQIAYVAYCPLGGWHEHKNLLRHSIIQQLVDKYQTDYYGIALAWLLQVNKIIPIPGMDKKKHVTMNKKAAFLSLTSEDVLLLGSLPDLFRSKHVDL